MSVDVVVVAYNSADVLPRCLDAAAKIGGLATVVVVDHGADGSAGIARERGLQAVTNPENPGYGAGQNRGREMGAAPYVLMLNPDAEIDAVGVARGVAVLDARPDVALVQGVIESDIDGSPERSSGAMRPIHLWGRALALRIWLDQPLVRRVAARIPALADHAVRTPNEPTDVSSLAAVAVLARRDAIDAIGGFDEQRYFLYGEDLDLSRRLCEAGWSLVALPDRWAAHRSGASSASNWDREVEWWRGTLAYGRRWWATWDVVSGTLAAAVMVARLIVRRPRSARRALTIFQSRRFR